MIRLVLPAHLRALAGVRGEVVLPLEGEVTQSQLLDALEERYPALIGTIRDRLTGRRRPFVRFFACHEDLSHDPPGSVLPTAVVAGEEPFVVLGAIAGG